uniref:Metalloprotease TIKI homolog n=1 Tax=Panagrellus redivivus TaxID=6233 RepID=A0A7E4ZY16_PANRE
MLYLNYMLLVVIGTVTHALDKTSAAECSANGDDSNNFFDDRSTHLWHVTLEGRSAPLYLFGTIHVYWQDVWPFVAPQVRAAFDSADTVLVELALNNSNLTAQLDECRDLPADVRLEWLLGYKLVSRIRKFIDKKGELLRKAMLNHRSMFMGEHAQRLLNFHRATVNWRNKKPTWVLFTLFHLLSIDGKEKRIPMLDVFLATEAQQRGKKVQSVESPQEQCDPLLGISDAEKVYAIEHTLNYLVNASSTEKPPSEPSDDLLTKYRCGEIDDSIYESTDFLDVVPPNSSSLITIQEQIRNEMILTRNKRMATRIHQFMMSNDDEIAFVALGAAHFYGKSSVVDVLQQLGQYNIIRVMSNDDISHMDYINRSRAAAQTVSNVRNLWERDESSSFEQSRSSLTVFLPPTKTNETDFTAWIIL